MRLLILTIIFNLAGCSAFHGVHQQSDLMQSEFKLTFIFDDTPIDDKKWAVGSATFWKGGCIIRINPLYYTHACLGHELRHCLEGYWHRNEKEPC